MDDRVCIGSEHRAAPLDDVFVAADHNEELARFHCGRTAADRCVDHRDTLCRSLLGDLAARVGMNGAVDGEDPT